MDAMTAGDVPILPPIELDKPCCTRIVDEYESGWCILDQGHEGRCRGTPARFTVATPPVDRKIKSAFNHDMALKWNHKTSARVQWLIKWNLPVDVLGDL